MNIDTIVEAQERIKSHIFETPLLRALYLENQDSKVFLKCENFQRTQSFKVRGAMNALLSLDNETSAAGVITRSSGNFAQALAYGGKTLGIKTTIVMPTNAPEAKLRKTAQYQPELIVHGSTAPEGDKLVKQLAEDRNLTQLSPYNDYQVMAGQGTAGLEIANELETLDYFFCPIGGGGLMAGVSTAIKAKFPECKIVGVEPAGADDYAKSRAAGYKVTLERVDTVADGLRTPTVGDLTYPVLNRNVDEVVTVSDTEISAAMSLIEDDHGILVEPSGAVALAGFKKVVCSTNSVTVIFVSGANI